MENHWETSLYNNKHAFVYRFGAGLVDLLAPKPGERILDLGCGSGQLTDMIARHGATAIGADKSPEMVADACARYPELDFHVKDASDFLFEEPFDAVFSNATLHWVPEAGQAVRCMAKNLKPGGRIVLEFGGKGNVKTILDALAVELTAKGYGKNAQNAVFYFPSISEYSSLLEANGFEVNMATLYDRPTELANPETGVIDWLDMFADSFATGIDADEWLEIRKATQNRTLPKFLKEGKLYADYRRIRVLATKKN
ncbi:SAM-dependent methyltransferase [Fulvitalea axinellae]|uniref:SAM-dependent methyltransferase n=1 Tax=Fulvitalea axinellae TaxID=1182444 RepID=A0AAU9CVV5_9BACT|nr:SAM-dependent methyltransferase [Fulvitalea axinellae]